VASTRRLAAIMFTDIVGFTASAQTDEARALTMLREQEELVRPIFTAHHGREVKSTGDGFLAVFDSALHAIECAVAIQGQMQERNARSEGAPIELRIGVHLGDVEERDSDIFGDAVNLAARIGPCAAPGGICVSGPVFDQVRNKIPRSFDKLEPKALKNVKFPIDLYRVGTPEARSEPVPEGTRLARIAVLPFTNISPDPADAYFADGLTEELITVLSQLRGLRVIARTSVNQYRSTAKPISQIGSELGVGSIIEGSVRKADRKIRVTVQLIDVSTQEHAWAKTFERELDDVFVLQSEIARLVAKHLKVKVRPAEHSRLEARTPVRPESYLAYVKGRTLLHDYSRDTLEAAKTQFELAISLDPTNAAAHSGLADATRLHGSFYPSVPREQWDAIARRMAATAVELDPNLAEAHASLAIILWDDYEPIAAEKEFKMALSLNPSYSWAHCEYGVLLAEEGRAEEALVEYNLAEAADPLSTHNLSEMAFLLLWLERWDDAMAKLQRLRDLEPSDFHLHLALAYYYQTRSDVEKCLAELDRVVELEPDPRWKALYRAQRFIWAGEPERAKALLRLEEKLPDYPFTAWYLARIYSELGDIDATFRYLEKARSSHLLPFHPFRLSPEFALFRRDPRFHVLLKKMNLG
jgi:adenylate cyclase